MSSPQKAYIVLVNWNGWRDTILCLESVLRLDHPDFTVVVCDNDSSDGSLDRIRRWCEGSELAEGANPALAHLTSPAVRKPVAYTLLDRQQAEQGAGDASPVVLVQTGANLGFAGGNNVGFRYALARGDADYIWALNNDTVVLPNTLVHLVAMIRKHPSIGICGATVRYMDAPDTIQALGGGRFNTWTGLGYLIGNLLRATATPQERAQGDEALLDYVFGASMFVSVEFLRAVGLMYEGYFLFFEELDWAERGAKAGFKLGYCADCEVYHRAGAATGSYEESAFSVFYLFRSRILYYKRFYPMRLVIAYPIFWLEAVKALVKGRMQRFLAISAALLGYPLHQPPAVSIEGAGQ